MSEFTTYLVENRHIFSVCPECEGISRLSDLELERKGRYAPDWLDDIDSKHGRLEERRFELEQKQKELREGARREAEREILPKRLASIAPRFARSGFDPRDVSAMFDPVEFVIFEGISTDAGVQCVTFYSLSPANPASKSLESAVHSHSYSWNLVRVADDGSLSQSKKFASGTVSMTLDSFESRVRLRDRGHSPSK